MKRNIFYAGLLLLGTLVSLGSCTQDIDESDLYTATGQTVEEFIRNDSDLTSFNYILQRSGYDRMMDSYGQYTCYAPVNEGVAAYVDSLWNDEEASVPHNGMTENSIEGLTDSLCSDIARYHLANGLYSIIEMGGGGSTVSTMLGRPFSTSVDTLGRTVLNYVAVITSQDNEVTNGYVHKISRVIPKTSRVLGDVFEHRDDYSIFSEALHRTGLADSVAVTRKDHRNSAGDYGYDALTGSHRQDTDNSELYCPTECKVGFTIFAESDAILARNGINSFDDLVEYANRVYGGAASWYDYIGDHNLSVSTGNDYTNRFNALNMFVAYHIVYGSMAQDQLVFERKAGVAITTSKWNYVNGGEPYDYYETMLPHTLLKIWEPDQRTTLYINRWKLNNTLTDEVGTTGSDAMHPIQQPGVIVTRQDIQAYNGYIHPIQGMLVYDENVPKGVLNERLRFEATTFLPEFLSNGFRYMSMTEVGALNGGGSGARIAFPVDYFDHVKVFDTEGTELRYNVKGNFRAYQADAFQGWGASYDLAVRLPPLPSGLYEFRLFYSPMGHGGMMQFYWGTKPSAQGMTALSIPLDVRIDESDPSIGWTDFNEEDDRGIATDEAMHNRGYMRGPYSFCGHPGEDGYGDDDKTHNCRGDGTVTLRRVLGRVRVRQGDDFWFRFKNVINDDPELKWQLDFVEFVPVSIVDNDQYSEDWY